MEKIQASPYDLPLRSRYIECVSRWRELIHQGVALVERRLVASRSGLEVSASDCGVKGPRFESHRGRLCLSRQPLRYTALGTGCAPFRGLCNRLYLSHAKNLD